MQQIVTITRAAFGGEQVNTVNARELWEKLGSKQDFSHWIKDRISGFTEGKDYLVYGLDKRGIDGRFAPTEYRVSFEVAEFYLHPCKK